MNRAPLRREAEPIESRTSGAEPADRHCFIVYVGGEAFGLPVEFVQTIFQIEAVTPVPLGPWEIAGLVNLRGKIVAAVSLRRRLQMPDAPRSKSSLAIGMEYRGENFALIVDEVGDVVFLDPQTQIPLPPHLNQHRTKLTDSTYRLDRGILSMLDVGCIFDFQRRA
jgi:purine-binding chemotaxis protein CheW